MQEFINDNLVWFLAILAWSLVWKGVALWRSARSGHKTWFVALLLINTVGLLEIVYIFAVNRVRPAVPTQQ